MAYQITTHREQKPRSGVAMGGLGCGWFELRQDGTFQNWNIFNNRPLGRGTPFPFHAHSVLFFILRWQPRGENPRLILLQIEESHNVASLEHHEFQYIFPWLSGVDTIRMKATFPFVDMDFSQKGLPLKIKLRAWSPFIPRDAKHSSLPVAFFDFTITSRSARPADLQLVASFRNCVGYDIPARHYTSRVYCGPGYVGFEHSAAHLPPEYPSAGTMGLVSLHPDSHYYLGWEHPHPYYERLLREPVLPNVDDTDNRNQTAPDGTPSCLPRCWSTIGRAVHLKKKGDSLRHTFAAVWHFPHNLARLSDDENLAAGYLEADSSGTSGPAPAIPTPHNEGHYYSNFFEDSAAVAAYAVTNRAWLEERTTAFHQAYYDADAPEWLLDQVNSQLNTFRTSTWFTRAGDFGILEGLSPTQSFAGLSTVDVAMYGGVATAALFPELDRRVIETHRRFQRDNGIIAHSISQNFREIRSGELSGKRIDLPAQYAVMALRAASWSGDRSWLESIWPSVQKALDYVLRERDTNQDGLPDMEGIMCSYDNFPMFGVAPYVATQWLAALAAAVEAARWLDDQASAERYQKVLEQGRERLESTCWNGQYFRLFSDLDGPAGRQDEGCLTDQMLGQWATHLSTLPGILNSERVRTALRSILRMNFKPDQGLRNCQWPGDGFLHPVADDCWVDQANTCWTGVELAFASFLIYEGMVEEGLHIIRHVDERYRRWGIYWDHQEFGGHYFRPMSAWAIIHALAGQRMGSDVLEFDPRLPGKKIKLFFVTTDGYGHLVRTRKAVELRVLDGQIRQRTLRLRPLLPAAANAALPRVLLQGKVLRARCTWQNGLAEITLPASARLRAESTLRVEFASQAG